MVQVIVDVYPDDNEFYAHLFIPDNGKRGTVYEREHDWSHGMEIMNRVSKHLRRVGFIDRSNGERAPYGSKIEAERKNATIRSAG